MGRAKPFLLAVAVLLAGRTAFAQQATLAGSVRNYNLLRVQDGAAIPDARRDIDFLSIRVTPVVALNDSWRVESHVVLETLAPPQLATAGLPGGSTQTFFNMARTFADNDRAKVTGRIDRLNVHLHTSMVDLTVGRQAISWGVNTLFPALDMFSPFAPTQIDRDYKAGVDGVRLTVSPRPHLELEAVGAQLGPREDELATAVGLMARVNTGIVDVGVMAGSFHHDAVVGGFVSVGVGGAVVRAEVARTVPDDPTDRQRRPSFWRAGLGLDRQLTSSFSLSAELGYNGFGERHASDYPLVVASPRFLRGEVAGPGQLAAGGTLNWHFHALGTLSTLAVLNLNDGSAAIMPLATWSVNSRLDLLGGAQIFAGHPPSPLGIPRSEYGGLGSAVVSGLKLYF